jgi:hypothetical protein
MIDFGTKAEAPERLHRHSRALHRAVRHVGYNPAEEGAGLCALVTMLIADTHDRLRRGQSEDEAREHVRWVSRVAEEAAFSTPDELRQQIEESRAKLAQAQTPEGLLAGDEALIAGAIDAVLERLASETTENDGPETIISLSLTMAGVLRLLMSTGADEGDMRLIWADAAAKVERLAFAPAAELLAELRAGRFS